MNKDKILACANELQSHMFKGLTAEQSFKQIRKTFDENTIQTAMKLLKTSRENTESPYKLITETVTRCMGKLGKASKAELNSVESFYKLAERAYKVFMNDEHGRAIPMVFMYIEGNGKLGLCPITEEGKDKSPMDYLKSIVYSSKPDAYCFCAEASMSKNVEESNHKYGDIINDPNSEDLLVITGNSKNGNKPIHKAFVISGEMGKLKFKPVKDFGKNMECSKLP
jgi:hypothetical protein